MTELLKRKALKPDAFVFGTIDGEYQTEFKCAWNTLFKVANEVLVEQGLDPFPIGRKVVGGFTWHDVRHEFGAQVAENTDDPLVIRDMLRHSTVAMSDKYLKAKEKRLKGVAARLGNRQVTNSDNSQVS